MHHRSGLVSFPENPHRGTYPHLYYSLHSTHRVGGRADRPPMGGPENRKTDRLLKHAGFRQNANLADISYSPDRILDKNMFVRLGTLVFIYKKEGLIICGASGVGKIYLA